MRPGFDPGVGKIPWKRKWQPTLVLLPGKSYGRRSLVGYSPLGRRVKHDWVTSLSLPAEPQGKPKNTRVGSLCLLQEIFLTQESNQGLLRYRWILYQLSYKRSYEGIKYRFYSSFLNNAITWKVNVNGMMKNNILYNYLNLRWKVLAINLKCASSTGFYRIFQVL